MRTPKLWHITAVVIILGFIGIACDREMTPETSIQEFTLVDEKATPKTVALYDNLSSIAENHVLFGHQDDLAYGVHWIDEPGRSDVYETAGAYPAVYGWELGDLELGAEENLDAVNFESMQGWIKEGYERGGVITLGWHMNNPMTGGDAWDTTEGTVATVLPGGEHHDVFTDWLDILVAFNDGLTSTDANGVEYHIPVIFRPWHEHNGSWFWWGRDLCSPEEYIALWRFTVEYLRDVKGVNNFLYAISPDRSRISLDSFEEDFLYAYPGDDYVDILGLDNYWDLGHPSNNAPADQQLEDYITSLEYTVQIAESRNKIPALSESGFEQIPNPQWWTDVYLAGLNANETTRKISYALVWRNANSEHDRPDHYYAPYPGHPSAENFREFRNHNLMLFESDLPNLYE